MTIPTEPEKVAKVRKQAEDFANKTCDKLVFYSESMKQVVIASLQTGYCAGVAAVMDDLRKA